MSESQAMHSEAKWEYDGPFLNWYPKNAQGTVANWFCYAVRDGVKTIHGVLQMVEYHARRKSATDAMTEEVLAQLIDDLGSQEAEDFAAFILWRESLPAEEKARLKAESETQHRNAYMAQERATVKQLSYLKALGCKVIPASKLEASQLIEEFLSKKGRAA